MKRIQGLGTLGVAVQESNATNRRATRAGKALKRATLMACMLAGCLHGTAFAGTTAALGLVVPSYFNATKSVADWNSMVTSAHQVSTTAILNPDNGPGTTTDPNYAAATARVRAAGGKVVGYVHTSYGKRSLSTVVAEINAYVALYKVDGFFIDEMSNDSKIAHIQYYQSLYNYIKGLNATYSVTANPGTNIPELYASLPTADTFVVFESTAKAYAKYEPLSWQAAYPKTRFVHMVYSATAAQMPGIVQYASTHGAGGVYVTSLGGSNPYKALPPYWSAEVANAIAP